MKLNIGGITGAGLSKKNKTGDWSFFIPLVDPAKCNGCGICELFCPEICIDIKDKIAIVDSNYCKGCRICSQECPREAISMQPKRGVVT